MFRSQMEDGSESIMYIHLGAELELRDRLEAALGEKIDDEIAPMFCELNIGRASLAEAIIFQRDSKQKVSYNNRECSSTKNQAAFLSSLIDRSEKVAPILSEYFFGHETKRVKIRIWLPTSAKETGHVSLETAIGGENEDEEADEADHDSTMYVSLWPAKPVGLFASLMSHELELKTLAQDLAAERRPVDVEIDLYTLYVEFMVAFHRGIVVSQAGKFKWNLASQVFPANFKSNCSTAVHLLLKMGSESSDGDNIFDTSCFKPLQHDNQALREKREILLRNTTRLKKITVWTPADIHQLALHLQAKEEYLRLAFLHVASPTLALEVSEAPSQTHDDVATSATTLAYQGSLNTAANFSGRTHQVEGDEVALNACSRITQKCTIL